MMKTPSSESSQSSQGSSISYNNWKDAERKRRVMSEIEKEIDQDNDMFIESIWENLAFLE